MGRHGEAVLASVRGDTQLEHDIVHGLGGIVERSTLTGQFGRPHPVAGTLYILQPGRQRPDNVRQCLPHTHAAHSSRIDQPFDGLLTYCGGSAGRTEMTLGDDSHVGDGELQGAGALLPRDQTRHATIDLRGEKPLRPHRQQSQHTIESRANRELGRQAQWLELGTEPLQLEHLLRHVTQNRSQLEVYRSRTIGLVMEHDLAITCHPTDERDGDSFSLAQVTEQLDVFRSQENGILLLVLRTPYLEYGQRFITERNLPDLDSRSRRFDNFLEHVAVAARPLIVDTHDGIAIAKFHARPNNTVHLLFHLGVAALDRIEIEFRDILALDHARRSTASHANPICRPADFDHPHPFLGRVFLHVPSIDLADSATEHDGFDPLATLAVRQPHAERSCIPLNERLAKLVTIIRRPIARLDLDLQRRSEIVRIGKV